MNTTNLEPSRRRAVLPTPKYGWERPWTNAFEVADALPTSKWTLVGGLMVQAHAIGHDIPSIRPTADVDLLLHVEVDPDVASDANRQITGLGYAIQEPFDRQCPHYRYRRGVDTVDVMVADHAAPRSRQELRGHRMFEAEGGTQALRRTMIYEVTAPSGQTFDFSVPDELGALVLKGAAHIIDQRDRDRHLFDAAVLGACLTDHAADVKRLGGSDRRRIGHLAEQLRDPRHKAWLALPERYRVAGQDTLRILSAPPRSALGLAARQSRLIRGAPTDGQFLASQRTASDIER